jgi:hypothetical protein
MALVFEIFAENGGFIEDNKIRLPPTDTVYG